jgi:hypothetical protein
VRPGSDHVDPVLRGERHQLVRRITMQHQMLDAHARRRGEAVFEGLQAIILLSLPAR